MIDLDKRNLKKVKDGGHSDLERNVQVYDCLEITQFLCFLSVSELASYTDIQFVKN